jgi:hypothetical protein
MLAMSNLEMFVLPFFGIAIMFLGLLPWFWVAHFSLRNRASRPHRSRWMQFGLRNFLFWALPIAAIAVWIATWDSPFFTKQRVLSHKAGALNILVLIVFLIAFLRSLRQMKHDLQHPAQSESLD